MTTTLGNTSQSSGIFNVSNNKACAMSITHTEPFRIKTFNAYVKGSSSSYTYYIKFCVWNSDGTLNHNTSTPVQVFWHDLSGIGVLYSLNVEDQNILCSPNTTYYIGYVAYCSNGDVHQGYITKVTEFINRLDSTNSYSSPQTYNPDERYQLWPAIYVEVYDNNTVSKIVGININNLYLLGKHRDNLGNFKYTPVFGNMSFFSNTVIIKPSSGWAIFCVGSTTTNYTESTQDMEYVTMTSTGNATDFGDFGASARRYIGCTSNNELGRGFTFGGQLASSGGNSSYIYLFSTNSTGNALSGGNTLTLARRYSAAISNGRNGTVVCGGGYSSSYTNRIDSFNGYSYSKTTTKTITDFGDLTVSRAYLSGMSNSTNERGVFAGGKDATPKNTIDYITINSTGNAADFGDLLTTSYEVTATSNGTNERGVIIGNATYNIQYITINSTGNAADFGDLTVTRQASGSTSNREDERGLVVGGYYSTTVYNTIDYITINSVGNAADFGDLISAKAALGACSN